MSPPHLICHSWIPHALSKGELNKVKYAEVKLNQY